MFATLKMTYITEFAHYILQDRQPVRAIPNYLHQTFDGLNETTLSAEGVIFDDRIAFYEHIISCLQQAISAEQERQLDHETE